jgi:hypothetical protein
MIKENMELVEYDGNYAAYHHIPGEEPDIEILTLDEFIEYCR